MFTVLNVADCCVEKPHVNVIFADWLAVKWTTMTLLLGALAKISRL